MYYLHEKNPPIIFIKVSYLFGIQMTIKHATFSVALIMKKYCCAERRKNVISKHDWLSNSLIPQT